MTDTIATKKICLWCERPTERRNYCSDKHMRKNADFNYLVRSRAQDRAEAQLLGLAAKVWDETLAR